jgi:hypothetical protein
MAVEVVNVVGNNNIVGKLGVSSVLNHGSNRAYSHDALIIIESYVHMYMHVG